MNPGAAPLAGPLAIERILELLPHRWPFVMVDRVTEMVPGERIRGHKCVAYNEPWFPAHFPGNALVPGVLLLECFAQIGGILALTSDGARPQGARMYVLAIDRAKFRRPVRPGDRLDLEVRVLQRRGSAWKLRGEGSVDGELAVEAELLADAAGDGSPSGA